jgi:hypothetical protein
VVCRASEAPLQSAELGIRADLDDPLCDDRGRGLANLPAGRRDGSADAAMARADDPKLCLVAGFFTLHHIAFALAIILTLFAVIVGFIWVQWRENRFAAALFIPYAAWVAFASLLNYLIYRLN